MEKQGRTKYWQPGDASTTLPKSTVLATVLEKTWVKILLAGGFGYDSQEFKSGIDQKQLVNHAETLGNFIDLDPRGAHISQLDLELGVKECSAKPFYKDVWNALKEKENKTDFELARALAYTLRVMFAHVRIKEHNHRKSRSGCDKSPQDLVKLYVKFEAPKTESATKKNQACVKNPFVSFRDEESDEDIEEENEDSENYTEDVVVVHYQMAYETTTIVAEAMLSDGTKTKARHYSPGDNGFAIAKFDIAGDIVEYETEIPNKYIASDEESLIRPLPAKPPVGKKVGRKATVKIGAAAKTKAKTKAKKTKAKTKAKAEPKKVSKRPASSASKSPKASKHVPVADDEEEDVTKEKVADEEYEDDAAFGVEEPDEEEPVEEEPVEEEEGGEGGGPKREQCQGLLQWVPKEAQPQTPLSKTAKSYTIKRDGHLTKVSVILYQTCFYVTPEPLPGSVCLSVCLSKMTG